MSAKFVETIRFNNGKPEFTEQHMARLNNTIHDEYGVTANYNINDIVLESNVPNGLIKCRILYSNTIESIEFQPYTFRKINSLKIVDGNGINYSKKYADRTCFNKLLALKGNCTEILITQNNCLTDTSFSNIVLYNGSSYITPTTYLLNGLRRQHLLNTGFIKEKPITINDLHYFTKLYLINTMINIEDNISIDVKNIYI